MKKIVLTMAMCLSMVSIASAAASTTGSTGLIDTPTADVVQPGHVSAGYYHLHEGNSASVGFGVFDNFEVSAARLNFDKGDHTTVVNAKYALMQEGVVTPGLAVGIEDIGDKNERTTYAVVSKGLPLGFRAHVGVGDGRYDGVFYGVEKSLVPGLKGVFPSTSLIVEHDGHEMNYGIRMSIVPTVKVNAGWRDDETYVGVTCSF